MDYKVVRFACHFVLRNSYKLLKCKKMNELDKILEKHIKNIEQKFKRIPKSRKHSGMLAEIQNKLENIGDFAKRAEKIVNEELDVMLKHVNTNLLDKYSEHEIDQFKDKAREKLKTVLQNGIRNSLK